MELFDIVLRDSELSVDSFSMKINTSSYLRLIFERFLFKIYPKLFAPSVKEILFESLEVNERNSVEYLQSTQPSIEVNVQVAMEIWAQTSLSLAKPSPKTSKDSSSWMEHDVQKKANRFD